MKPLPIGVGLLVGLLVLVLIAVTEGTAVGPKPLTRPRHDVRSSEEGS